MYFVCGTLQFLVECCEASLQFGFFARFMRITEVVESNEQNLLLKQSNFSLPVFISVKCLTGGLFVDGHVYGYAFVVKRLICKHQLSCFI